jgi:hypothetical protein
MTTTITTTGITTTITTTRLYPGLDRKAGPCPPCNPLTFI